MRDRVTPPLAVDGAPLRADVERTAEFGAVDAAEGRGRTALPADEANARARDYLVERMGDLGLDVTVDAVGNVAGRWTPPSADPDAAPVAAGSHLDSVPRGGIFDGPLGVYAALEAVRALRASNAAPARPVEVVCFTGEEGTRFADGVLGSTVAAGEESVERALGRDDGDVTLAEALDRVGYRGEGRLDASEWDAWVELHIEQSRRLADAGVPVGVVTDIAGTVRGRVTIEGEADHAGTTGMADRRDALAAASDLVGDVERTAADLAASGTGTAVGTVGRLGVEPNAVNVVPGSVSMRLDLRSTDRSEIRAQRTAVERALADIGTERAVETTLDWPYDIPPTPLSGGVRDAVERAAGRCDTETVALHSGAGHDTMQVAAVTDAALLFVRSTNGHSHSPHECAEWDDCVAATRVLAESIRSLASADAASHDSEAAEREAAEPSGTYNTRDTGDH